MQRLRCTIGGIFLTVLWASCTQSAVKPLPKTAFKTSITILKSRSNLPKKDWIAALETFAPKYPIFAGSDFSADRKEFIFYIAKKHNGKPIVFASNEARARELDRMHQAVFDLIDTTTGFPEASDATGKSINPRSLRLKDVDVLVSLADLNRFRKTLTVLLSDRTAYGISTNFAKNQVELSISNTIAQKDALEFIRKNNIPIENVYYEVPKRMIQVFKSTKDMQLTVKLVKSRGHLVFQGKLLNRTSAELRLGYGDCPLTYVVHVGKKDFTHPTKQAFESAPVCTSALRLSRVPPKGSFVIFTNPLESDFENAIIKAKNNYSGEFRFELSTTTSKGMFQLIYKRQQR